MNNLKNADLIALFENIATTHPEISHDAASVDNEGKKNKLRFWKFNGKELPTGEKSDLDTAEGHLILGLSLPGKGEVTWNYSNTGTISRKDKFFDVAVVGKFAPSDFASEELVCAKAEKVIDEIYTWLEMTSFGNNKCAFPIIEKIDLSGNNCRRVSNVGVSGYSGATMRLHVRDMVKYNKSTNPLDAMTP